MNYELPVLHSRLWTEAHSHIDIDQLSLHNVQQCILSNAETNVDLTHTQACVPVHARGIQSKQTWTHLNLYWEVWPWLFWPAEKLPKSDTFSIKWQEYSTHPNSISLFIPPSFLPASKPSSPSPAALVLTHATSGDSMNCWILSLLVVMASLSPRVVSLFLHETYFLLSTLSGQVFLPLASFSSQSL